MERIDHLHLMVEQLPKDESMMRTLETKISRAKQEAKDEVDRIDRDRTKACDSVSQLRAQRDKELDELRGGYWHDKCSRTASQILEQDHEELDVHLAREGGKMVPAPESVIRQRERSFDERIAAARAQCTTLGQKVGDAKQKWANELRALEARRPEIERKKQELLVEKRAELDRLQQSSRDLVMKQRERSAKVDRDLQVRLDELAARREQLGRDLALAKKQLQIDHDKAIQAHAQKGRELFEQVSAKRNELVSLRDRIRNAHNQVQNLDVTLHVTFK